MSDTGLIEIEWGRKVKPILYNRTVQREVYLYGYSIYETSGAASAQLNIYNGVDNTGLLVCPILLAKSQSAEDWFGPQGIELDVGLFTSVISGAVNGSLFVHFPHLAQH